MNARGYFTCDHPWRFVNGFLYLQQQQGTSWKNVTTAKDGFISGDIAGKMKANVKDYVATKPIPCQPGTYRSRFIIMFPHNVTVKRNGMPTPLSCT